VRAVSTGRDKKNFNKSKMFVILREIECGRGFSSMIFAGNCEIPHFLFYYKMGDQASDGKLLLVVRNTVSSGLFDKQYKNIGINSPPIYRLLINAYWHTDIELFISNISVSARNDQSR